MSYENLKEHLEYYADVFTLCDLMEITERELLDKFEDRIEEYEDTLVDYLPAEYSRYENNS